MILTQTPEFWGLETLRLAHLGGGGSRYTPFSIVSAPFTGLWRNVLALPLTLLCHCHPPHHTTIVLTLVYSHPLFH
jgi:hypothetical protein